MNVYLFICLFIYVLVGSCMLKESIGEDMFVCLLC